MQLPLAARRGMHWNGAEGSRVPSSELLLNLEDTTVASWSGRLEGQPGGRMKGA